MTNRGGFHAVDQLRPSNERHAQAGKCKQHSAVARIGLHIMEAALDRADRDGIGHQIRLEPRLDGEKSGEAFQHIPIVKQTAGQWRSSAIPGLTALVKRKLTRRESA